MERNTTQVSVSDKISKLDEEIEELKAEASEVEDRDSEEWAELESDFSALMRRKQKFEEAVEKMGGDTFTIQELSFGQLMMVRDEVLSKSFDTDVNRGTVEGVPREGYYKITTLKQAVVQYPPEQKNDPKELPNVVGEWLYDEVDNFNTGLSEDSIEDFSLEAAVEGKTK